MANRFSIEAVVKAIDRITAPFSKMGRSIKDFAKKAERALRTVDRAVGKVVGALKKAGSIAFKGLTVGVTAATAAVVSFTKEFAKIEDAEAAFTPLLGGAENARQAVEDINKAAAETPFRFEDLASATQTLVGLGGVAQDDIIPTLKMLGDTAGGSAQKLQGITVAYSQIRAGGKAMGNDLMQLINNGVPLLAELADMWGVNTVVAKEMVSEGRATAEEVEKAFRRMTTSGGKFFQGMLLASRTTTGLWSTFQDEMGQAQAAIGKGLSPVVKELIKEMTVVAQSVKAWAQANEGLIAQRVGDWVKYIRENFDKFVTIGKRIAIVTGVILGLIVALKSFILVMTAVNLVMAANPVALIVIGVMALIAALAAAVIYWDDIKEAAGLAIDYIVTKWDNLVNAVKDASTAVSDFFDNFLTTGPLAKVVNFSANLFEQGLAAGFGQQGATNGNQGSPAPMQMVSPESRVARSIEETRNTSTAEVTIKDTTGRAEVTSGTLGRGVKLMASGGA